MPNGLDSLRAGLTTREQVVLVVVALSPLAWLPIFVYEAAPRIALAVSLIPLGGMVLARDVRRLDPASISAVAFLSACVLSSIVSPAPWHSVLGVLEGWSGCVAIAAGFAWWSLARDLGQRALALIVPLLTVGGLWNAAIALAQVVLKVDAGTLETLPGRGAGTMNNAVYYGTFMAGLAAVWIARARSARAPLIVVALLSFGVALGAGRVAVGSVVLVALWQLWSCRADVRASLATALTAGAGLVVGSAIPYLFARDTVGVVSRASSGDGLGVRLDIWKVGLRAALERPLLGWGPSNVEIATERNFDLDYVRSHLDSDDTLIRWIDAHNIVVNVVVTTGVVGLALALAFAFFATRRLVDRSLLVGVVAIAINWMVQPITVHSLPIAALLLGASVASSRRSAHDVFDHGGTEHDGPAGSAPASPDGRASNAAPLAIGFIAAVYMLGSLLIADLSARRERLDIVDSVMKIGYRDAFVVNQLAIAHRLAAMDSADLDGELAKAQRHAVASAEMYPVVAYVQLESEIAYLRGDVERAIEVERNTLRLQPWVPLAHERLAYLSQVVGDEASYQDAVEAMCKIGTGDCDASRTTEAGVTD